MQQNAKTVKYAEINAVQCIKLKHHLIQIQKTQKPSKRVKKAFPHHQRYEARIGSNVTFADRVKRHVCL